MALSDVEYRFETLFWRNGHSVFRLFKINRHILLALLYYLAKNNIVICAFSGNVIFSHIILLMQIKKKIIENKTRVLVVSTTFVQNIYCEKIFS